MKRSEQLKTIREAFDSLPDLQDGFRDVKDRLLDMNERAERQHRKGAPSGIKHGLSIKDAAKLFVVSHLLDGWKAPEKWAVEHILSIRNECLYGQAYAKRFHIELAAWATHWQMKFAEVDYSELMK
jgi:hypothetical protein